MRILSILIVFIFAAACSQKDCRVENGLLIEGSDTLAHFNPATDSAILVKCPEVK